MRVPQVSERIKEAPAQAQRGVASRHLSSTDAAKYRTAISKKIRSLSIVVTAPKTITSIASGIESKIAMPRHQSAGAGGDRGRVCPSAPGHAPRCEAF